MTGTMKSCARCKSEKRLDQFSPQKTGKHGCHSYCKECRSEMNKGKAKEWYAKNRERVKERRAKTKEREDAELCS